MSSKSTRTLTTVAILILAALAAYWYWSPHLAMSSMKSAADKQDADAFNQYVDYPKLRDSLKGQFSAKMTEALGQQPHSGSDVEKAGSALGTMLGLAFADRLIDAMVRPEMVMKAMSEAKLQSPVNNGGVAGAPTSPKKVKWSIDRKGVDRVIAHGTQMDGTAEDSAGFVFDRSGFATWKLTEIRLPPSK